MKTDGPYLRFTRRRGEKMSRLEVAASVDGPWVRLPMSIPSKRIVSLRTQGFLGAQFFLKVNKDVMDLTHEGAKEDDYALELVT